MALTVAGGTFSGVLGIVFGLFGGFQPVTPVQLATILGAGMLMAIYIWPYFEALKRDDASTVVPLFQLVPVFVLGFSALFLGESLSARQWIGFALILVSGLALGAEKLDGRLFRLRPSLWYMVLSCLLYASVLVLFRISSLSIGFWPTLTYEFIGTGIASLMLLFIPSIRRVFSRQMREVRSIVGIIAVNNVICILAQMSEAFALSLVAAPLVSIVGGAQPLFVLLIGYILTRWYPHITEEDVRAHILGMKFGMIALMGLGLYFVYL
jgi:drug/metabolite transporter (DMT)-like permease